MKSGHRFEVGDLVWMRSMMETGLVVEPPFVSELSGKQCIGILLSDSENVVVKTQTKWCELISRPFGSTSLPVPFPNELKQGKGPKMTKFSSSGLQLCLNHIHP